MGIEGTGAISPNFNGRLGVNFFDFGIQAEESDIDYDANVQLLSVSVLVDWFPSKRSGFRVTAGLVYNNNKVDATAQPTATLDIGGVDFPTAVLGQLESELTFPNTSLATASISYFALKINSFLIRYIAFQSSWSKQFKAQDSASHN